MFLTQCEARRDCVQGAADLPHKHLQQLQQVRLQQVRQSLMRTLDHLLKHMQKLVRVQQAAQHTRSKDENKQRF